MHTLSQEHRDLLHSKYGLTDKTIDTYGFWSCNDAEGREALNWPDCKCPSLAGIVIPYPGVPGYFKIRLDMAWEVQKDGSKDFGDSFGHDFLNRDGVTKKIKYLATKDDTFRMFVPPENPNERFAIDDYNFRIAALNLPDPIAIPKINNPDELLAITEGEFKAALLNQQGVTAIGIPGVWMAHDPQFKTDAEDRGDKDKWRLNPLLSPYILPGRDVAIVFDTPDMEENLSVMRAARTLAKMISDVKAVPKIVYVPPVPGLDKTGVDDYYVAAMKTGTLVNPINKLTWDREGYPSRLTKWLKEQGDHSELGIYLRQAASWVRIYYENDDLQWKKWFQATTKACGLTELDFIEKLAGPIWFRRNQKQTQSVQSVAPLTPNIPTKTDLDIKLEEYNKEYFVLDDHGRAYVCAMRADESFNWRPRLARYSFNSFRELNQTQRVEVKTASGSKSVLITEEWLNWNQRRQYKGVTFDPSWSQPPGWFNLWTGWGVKPAQGDWGLLKDHVFHVLCNDSQESFDYIMGWLRFLVQKPWERPETALVFRGTEGVGKSMFGLAISKIAGSHSFNVSNARHLVGNFNSHLQNVILLQADEAFFAGDKAHVNVLKSIITDPKIVIEGKGRDAIQCRNNLHIMMTSNEDWVVPASLEARRFAVFDVVDTKRGNENYFRALASHIGNDATIAAMLYDLKNEPLGAFNPRLVPQTKALEDQRIRSLRGVNAWLLDVLTSGDLDNRGRYGENLSADWQPFVATQILYKSYTAWAQNQKYPLSEKIFSSDLGKIFPWKCECPRSLATATTPARKPGYLLGTIEQARSRFCEKTGLSAATFEESSV